MSGGYKRILVVTHSLIHSLRLSFRVFSSRDSLPDSRIDIRNEDHIECCAYTWCTSCAWEHPLFFPEDSHVWLHLRHFRSLLDSRSLVSFCVDSLKTWTFKRISKEPSSKKVFVTAKSRTHDAETYTIIEWKSKNPMVDGIQGVWRKRLLQSHFLMWFPFMICFALSSCKTSPKKSSSRNDRDETRDERDTVSPQRSIRMLDRKWCLFLGLLLVILLLLLLESWSYFCGSIGRFKEKKKAKRWRAISTKKDAPMKGPSNGIIRRKKDVEEKALFSCDQYVVVGEEISKRSCSLSFPLFMDSTSGNIA